MALGGGHRVVELDQSARTAADAARALGCRVDQIVKSLVFRGQRTDRAVLVTVSGANRVDEAKVSALIGETIGRADAAFVRECTGYAIGGVPPLGHARALPALIDRELLRFDTVYAAGGTPHAMFPLLPTDLVRVANGTVADVALLAN